MSFVLLNSGDKLLLNDGSSFVLLNAEALTTGVEISGSQAAQAFYDKRPVTKIPLEFRFRIKANTIKRITIELFGELLEMMTPDLIYSDKLRYSFQLPIVALRDKVGPALKRLHTKLELEAIVTKAQEDPNAFLYQFAALLKKMEKKLGRN